MGVDYVLVHPTLMPGEPPAAVPAGLVLVRSFSFDDQFSNPRRDQAYLAPWYDIDIYRIRPGPIADFVAIPAEGFDLPELAGWHSRNWMTSMSANIDVISLDPQTDHVRLSFDLTSFAIERFVRVSQAGRTLWEGNVGTGPSPISILASPGQILIETDTDVIPVREIDPTSGDPRALSVLLSNISVGPAPP